MFFLPTRFPSLKKSLSTLFSPPPNPNPSVVTLSCVPLPPSSTTPSNPCFPSPFQPFWLRNPPIGPPLLPPPHLACSPLNPFSKKFLGVSRPSIITPWLVRRIPSPSRSLSRFDRFRLFLSGESPRFYGPNRRCSLQMTGSPSLESVFPSPLKRACSPTAQWIVPAWRAARCIRDNCLPRGKRRKSSPKKPKKEDRKPVGNWIIRSHKKKVGIEWRIEDRSCGSESVHL